MLVHAARVALAPILYAQARRLRAIALVLPEPRGPRQGNEGQGELRLRVLVTGDSSAAGVGADTQDEALARPLATALARRLRAGIAWQWAPPPAFAPGGWLGFSKTHPAPPADVGVPVVGVNP